jgi:hypothetical protein
MNHINPGRTSRQCRERWENYLAPSARKTSWTPQEDQLLIESQQRWGNKWAKIASLIPGRTDNAVKNRWNSALKRRIEISQSAARRMAIPSVSQPRPVAPVATELGKESPPWHDPFDQKESKSMFDDFQGFFMGMEGSKSGWESEGGTRFGLSLDAFFS